jgi:hypothetical protein
MRAFPFYRRDALRIDVAAIRADRPIRPTLALKVLTGFVGVLENRVAEAQFIPLVSRADSTRRELSTAKSSKPPPQASICLRNGSHL